MRLAASLLVGSSASASELFPPPFLLLLFLSLRGAPIPVDSWTPPPSLHRVGRQLPFRSRPSVISPSFAVGGDGGGGGDGADADWRAFKARLVNMERLEEKSMASSGGGAAPHLEEDGLILEEGTEVFKEDGGGGGGVAGTKTKAVPSPSSHKSTLLDAPGLWAYDVSSPSSPDHPPSYKHDADAEPLSSLRPGSVLLYRPLPPGESAGFYGYGLGRQYLHKSVVLVQEVTEEFCTGILLNRGPYGEGWGLINRADGEGEEKSEYEDDGGVGWDVWFGGDARSLIDDEGYVEGGPVFYCLHSLSDSSEARKVSMERFPGVYFTTPSNARALAEAGLASPLDFWTFCGYLHWSAEQIEEEVRGGLWHVVETDPAALFREMKVRREGSRERRPASDGDEDYAGIGHWDALMEMIVRRDECVVECEIEYDEDDGMDHTFDDAMLREWMEEKLRNPPSALMRNPAIVPKLDVQVRAGDIVRALCPAPSLSGRGSRSPFLLSDHEFHKSLVLIIQDDDNFSVGVLLNIPSARTVEMQVTDTSVSFFKHGPVTLGKVPVRYGGPFDFVGTGDVPLFFLHRCRTLVDAGIGELVGGGGGRVSADSNSGGADGRPAGIWRCTVEEATDAIRRGISSQEELLAVNGFCVWEKDGTLEGGGGMTEEILDSRFEVVSADRVGRTWDLLLRQRLLSVESVEKNLDLAMAAWEEAGNVDGVGYSANGRNGQAQDRNGLRTLSLADSATRRWVEGFLLSESDFRESNMISE